MSFLAFTLTPSFSVPPFNRRSLEARRAHPGTRIRAEIAVRVSLDEPEEEETLFSPMARRVEEDVERWDGLS
jgi:hypothetical protein